MKLKCVIFDMDGLMFDTERIVSVIHKEAASHYGYCISDSMIENLLGGNSRRNAEYLREQFGLDYPVELVRKRLLTNRDAYIQEHGLPMKEGLLEILQYLKEEKIKIAVASSSPYSVVKHYLEISDTLKYMDYIITGDQVVNSKPDPEIFLNVCTYFDILPNDALVLEDSRNGIMAAVNGNIPVICVPDLVIHPIDITKLTYKTVPSLLQVITVIKEMEE